MLQAVADPTTADFARVERTGACSIGKDEGLCASDIEERVRLSQPTISHTCQFSRKRDWWRSRNWVYGCGIGEMKWRFANSAAD
jgi:predicted transcriptional regulator